MLWSCDQNKPVENENVEVIMTKHGADITTDNAVEIAEFETLFSGKDSLEIKLVGTIGDVCQTKGCWMTLNMDDSQTMMVRFKDYEFFVPKDASGKTAIIEGIARVDTISVAERKHYLEDNNASQEEIDAITEPEITYSFEASGVIIKEEIVSNEE
jgi:hypothetical protein